MWCRAVRKQLAIGVVAAALTGHCFADALSRAKAERKNHQKGNRCFQHLPSLLNHQINSDGGRGVPGHALSRWRAGLRFEECELTKGPQRMTPLRAKDEFKDVGTIRLQLRSGPRRTVACQKATASKAVLTNKIKIKLRGPINRDCRKASVLHFRCAAF